MQKALDKLLVEVGVWKAYGVQTLLWLLCRTGFGVGRVTQGELWSIFLALAATIMQVRMEALPLM